MAVGGTSNHVHDRFDRRDEERGEVFEVGWVAGRMREQFAVASHDLPMALVLDWSVQPLERLCPGIIDFWIAGYATSLIGISQVDDRLDTRAFRGTPSCCFP